MQDNYLKLNSKGEPVKTPITFSENRRKYLNKEFETTCGSKIIVEDYINKFNVSVRFLDDTNFKCIANIDNIKAGHVKNPYSRTIYGGYFGEGKYKAIDNMKIYKVWEGILKRAYAHLDRIAYYNCTVDESWLNFQIFCEWYLKKQSVLNEKYWDILQIDKDILQWNYENKIYSESTCCLIPKELNSMLVSLSGYSNGPLPRGVQRNYNKFSVYINYEGKRKYYGTFKTPEEAFERYKIEKKKLIINTADKYLYINAIEKDIYDELLKIEILP